MQPYLSIGRIDFPCFVDFLTFFHVGNDHGQTFQILLPVFNAYT